MTAGAVSLVIPPNSLSEDTRISIVPDEAAAIGEGYGIAGAAYRFSPPGTQFSLANPAVLTMPYDPASLGDGLDGRTLELAYFDEDLDRYLSIGGAVDPVTGTISAKVEHFTLYVAIASSLVPGNNAPTITAQGPIPATVTAGAPLYVRALIRDYDLGGSISAARVYYRTDTASPFNMIILKPEATLDVYSALIPSHQIVAGPSTVDLEYYFEAVDNLGATRATTPITVDIVRSYTPGTLMLAPATPAIAAGFERTFATTGRNDLNASFALVPQHAGATNDIGLTSLGSTGVTFKARKVGSGQVSAGFGVESASLPVTVFNGKLERIAILDANGLELESGQVVTEGDRFQLDALGYDAYGNSVLVNPEWTIDVNLGHVSSSGFVDTLMGTESGQVGAQVGDIFTTRWFTVVPRQWNTETSFGSGTTFSFYEKLTSRGGVPYAIYSEDNVLRVSHKVGSSWVNDPDLGPWTGGAFAIAGGNSRLQVVYGDGTHIRSAHLEAGGWVQDGDVLDVDTGATTDLYQVDIAMDGDTPYVTWYEYNAGAYNVYVRRWNGSAWVLVGGQVEGVGETAYWPQIAIHDGEIFVAYTTGAHVYVRRWTGSAWQLLGGFINLYPGAAGTLDLTIAGGQPTIAFTDFVSHVNRRVGYVQRWNGSTWVQQDAGGLWAPPGFDTTQAVAVAADGDALYVAWIEQGPSGSRRRVSRRNLRTGSWEDLVAWGSSPFSVYEIELVVAGGTVYVSTSEYVDGVHYRSIVFAYR